MKHRFNKEDSVLQFWSGGADSTYLLLQNLMCKRNVTCVYVSIINNRKKCEREAAAREKLKEDIKIFCKHFNCPEPRYYPDSAIRVSGKSFNLCPMPQQIMFAMFSLLLGNDFGEIQMGVVLGDSIRGVHLNEAIVDAYKESTFHQFRPITYPIEDVSKEAIYLTLKGYDDTLGTDFIGHLTCCEQVDKPCGEKKKCHPCRTQAEVFRRLKWKK